MMEQFNSLAARLSEAGSPYGLYDWETKDGYYLATCRVSKDDVPQLIEIAAKWSDLDWPTNDLELGIDVEDAELLPVTAWRTLADLKASEAVEPLVQLLCELDDEYDDWASDELPHVFGKIGAAAIDALDRVARDDGKPEFTRTIAAEALHRIAEYYPETRDRVVGCLIEMMTNASDDNVHLNSIVLVGLVELRAVEAAEAIERAFASNRLDVGMMGDWEDIRRRLGVEGLGLEMPKQPINSIMKLRRRLGLGIFSQEPIFGRDGVLTEAAEDYCERAWELFSKSQEAEQIVERFGDLRWFVTLLRFGIEHLGEVIDEMTLNSVREFVLDYVPRKVSVQADAAEEIVLELTKFWEYVNRVYELPNARPIIEWLKSDGLAEHLEAELADPANFGMAKSIVMSGHAAGYDMTTEEGMAEFMMAYNQSQMKQSRKASTNVMPSATVHSSQQRVGRNDPCPCGSGKKFKKCCRNL